MNKLPASHQEKIVEFKRLFESSVNKSDLKNNEIDSIEVFLESMVEFTHIPTGSVYYTFAIKNSTEGYIENAVLSELEDGSFQEFLVRYDKSDVENQEIIELENGSIVGHQKNVDCEYVTVWVECSSGEHHSGNIDHWHECTAETPPSAFTYLECDTVEQDDYLAGDGGGFYNNDSPPNEDVPPGGGANYDGNSGIGGGTSSIDEEDEEDTSLRIRPTLLTSPYELDDPLEHILDPSFKENECLMTVWNNAGSVSKFNEYLEGFNGNVANLRFKAADSISSPYFAENPDLNARTNFVNPSSNRIEIIFNTDNLNRPSYTIFRTLIHEMIHATMFRWLLIATETGNLDIPNMTQEEEINFIHNLENDFPGIYDYWYRYSAGTFQHELMAQHYRDIISNALEEYYPGQPQFFYQALSWVGLMGNEDFDPDTYLYSDSTQSWIDLDVIERENIITFIDYFEANNPNNCN